MFKNINKKRALVALILFVVAVLFPVVVTNTYWQRVLAVVFMDTIVVFSIQMICGYCGLLDFGRSAFVGLGGYSCALLVLRLNFPWLLAFLCAGLFAAAIGAFLGIISKKATFDYLSLTSIGFSEMLRLVFLNWTDVTNGAIGLLGVKQPNLFGFVINTNTRYYYFALILMIICYILIDRMLNKSKLGRAWAAMRDDDVAAAFSGVNIANYKTYCFTLGSFFTGIAGAVMVSYAAYASPYNYSQDENLIFLQMAILSGLGGLPGSIVGTAVLVILPELSRTFYDYRLMIMGLMMVILMTFAPNGLLGRNGISDRIAIAINRKKAKKAEAAGGDSK